MNTLKIGEITFKIEEEVSDLIVTISRERDGLEEALRETEKDFQSLRLNDLQNRSHRDAFESRAIIFEGVLENLVCEADDLSSHEIDGGAPDNRWEDMRIALIAAKQAIKDLE